MSDPTIISAAPFIADLKPYIDALIVPIVGGVLTWMAAKFSQWTNVQISQTQIEKLKSAAATEAGALVAGAEDNFAKKTVTVGNPTVVAAAARIAAALPDTMASVGATPEALQKFVVGEIGKLQAQTATPTPVPVSKP